MPALLALGDSFGRARLAFDQPMTLLVGHLAKRNRGANLSLARELDHPLAHLAISGRAPRRDDALTNREIRIWDHLLQVQLDGAAEALAFGARADGAVG